MPMEWKQKLREEGFLEVGPFRVELSLDNTFMDIELIPRILVYDGERERWHVLRNAVEKGDTFEEMWENAVKTLERIALGKERPAADDADFEERFARALELML
ncbi:hypothetical protein [Palaeococcus ferrophilus]|uniref:hypothetical protein n=1 Tax=Palaeococcus ferrophilus TaxID=83868 RepID=UPI001FE03C1A|nr:hypothetical protein [Palaeococcus ferrophilus]